MAWPATSSMTTNCGSLRPDSRATMVAAGTPRMGGGGMPRRRAITSAGGEGWARHANAAQRRTVATEPQVPGPGLPKPAPKKVAMVHAQRVFFIFGLGCGFIAHFLPSDPLAVVGEFVKLRAE